MDSNLKSIWILILEYHTSTSPNHAFIFSSFSPSVIPSSRTNLFPASLTQINARKFTWWPIRKTGSHISFIHHTNAFIAYCNFTFQIWNKPAGSLQSLSEYLSWKYRQFLPMLLHWFPASGCPTSWISSRQSLCQVLGVFLGNKSEINHRFLPQIP